jgi:hypothetical protein
VSRTFQIRHISKSSNFPKFGWEVFPSYLEQPDLQNCTQSVPHRRLQPSLSPHSFLTVHAWQFTQGVSCVLFGNGFDVTTTCRYRSIALPAIMFQCGSCSRSFDDFPALNSHCDAKGHNASRSQYCEQCRRHFPRHQALEQVTTFSRRMIDADPK